MTSSGVKEISLGDDFGDVVVKVNGARLEIRSDGSIDAYTNGAIKVHPAANDDAKTAAITEPKPGDRMADGSIYVGVSPDTGKPMYATPGDAPLTMKWKAAMEYAAKLDAHGHDDWRVPTKRELDVLFNNRAAIGGFDISGSHPAGWYWSSSQNFLNTAWDQRFSDGLQNYHYKSLDSSLRCVR